MYVFARECLSLAEPVVEQVLRRKFGLQPPPDPLRGNEIKRVEGLLIDVRRLTFDIFGQSSSEDVVD